MHGRGRFHFETGDQYEGYFKNGQREGQGIYTWADHSFHKGIQFIQIGLWKSDSLNGLGTFQDSKGAQTKGIYS